MEIEIEGKPSRVSTNLIIDATNFYGKLLLGKRLEEKIYLKIIFEHHTKMDKDTDACCEIDDFDSPRPRDFIITIRQGLYMHRMLEALAHEMVHLKQYAKGELKDLIRPPKLVRWKTEYFHADKTDYYFAPWEIEAYGLQQGLLFKFMLMKDEYHGKSNEMG